jgi:DNA-directed RNA polymerase subunit beta
MLKEMVVVEYVDATTIRIRYERTDMDRLLSFDDDVKTYKLIKFLKTNQNTTVNLKPIVKTGDKVKKGRCFAMVMLLIKVNWPLAVTLW